MDPRSSSFYRELCKDVRRHCEAKGYRDDEKGINNFIPHDAIAAYAMAKLLRERFDHFVAIAPEGHIYGYFFERDGTTVLSVVADYPPTKCSTDDDLSVLKGKNVLLIEDDVVSGRTLRLVVTLLSQFKPGSMSLYLGHSIGIQHLENVPQEIGMDRIYLAERTLNMEKVEKDFLALCKLHDGGTECPNCGTPAELRHNEWECPKCGYNWIA